MLSIGAAASALAIFEELEIWDKIIECYKIMDRLNKVFSILVFIFLFLYYFYCYFIDLLICL